MLRSDLCHYSDAYIVVKGRISVRGTNAANKINKKLTFKNDAPLIDIEEDIDIAMSMYNLLKYSDKYFMTSGSSWNYHRDKVNYDTVENNVSLIKKIFSKI